MSASNTTFIPVGDGIMISAYEVAWTDGQATTAVQLPPNWASFWDAQMRTHVIKLLSSMRGAEAIILMNMSLNTDLSA